MYPRPLLLTRHCYIAAPSAAPRHPAGGLAFCPPLWRLPAGPRGSPHAASAGGELSCCCGRKFFIGLWRLAAGPREAALPAAAGGGFGSGPNFIHICSAGGRRGACSSRGSSCHTITNSTLPHYFVIPNTCPTPALPTPQASLLDPASEAGQAGLSLQLALVEALLRDIFVDAVEALHSEWRWGLRRWIVTKWRAVTECAQ